MLTVGNFLLTVELSYLQLTIFVFFAYSSISLTFLVFYLQLELFYLQWEKVRLISTLRDCKPRSSTASKQAPTVGKQKTSPVLNNLENCPLKQGRMTLVSAIFLILRLV